MIPIYAHIQIELSKAGLHAYCEETEDEIFIPKNVDRVHRTPAPAAQRCRDMQPRHRLLPHREGEAGGEETY